ncbi:hypothetical protein V8F20_007125 [Naviculisporaceae sp. PSN 640]
MKTLFITCLLATAATAIPPISPLLDISATRCHLKGSGNIICRSCPSLDCHNMATWKPGEYVNVECMCHGQMQDGVDSWLYVKNKDCYIRQPRTDCCERESSLPGATACPFATTAPAHGTTAADVGEEVVEVARGSLQIMSRFMLLLRSSDHIY